MSWRGWAIAPGALYPELLAIAIAIAIVGVVVAGLLTLTTRRVA